MAKQPRIGGSFAPPIDEALLAQYQQLAAAADPQHEQAAEALRVLLNCFCQWWEQPESGPDGSRPHPSGRGTIVPLDEPIAQALYQHIPWREELDMYAALFERIDAHKHAALRNAAFHLLWYARELDLDREPITADKV